MAYDLLTTIKRYPKEITQQEKIIRLFAENKLNLKDIHIDNMNSVRIQMNGIYNNLKLFLEIGYITTDSLAFEDKLIWSIYAIQKEKDTEKVDLEVPIEFTMNDFYRLDLDKIINILLIEPNIYKYYFNLFELAVKENKTLEVEELKIDNREFILYCKNGLEICSYSFEMDGDIDHIKLPIVEGIHPFSLNLYADTDLIQALLHYLKTGTIMVQGFDIIRLMRFINTHKAFDYINYFGVKERVLISEHNLKELTSPNIEYALFERHIQTQSGLIFPLKLSISEHIVLTVKIDSEEYVEQFVSIDGFTSFIEKLYNL